jgi:hypothetical protein
MKYPSYLCYLCGWRTQGKVYRFPRCCVFHYSRGTTALELSEKSPIKYKLFTQSILDGTGYIPCQHCLSRGLKFQNKRYKEIFLSRKKNRFSKRFKNRLNNSYYDNFRDTISYAIKSARYINL